MKIRTITTGFTLKLPLKETQVKKIAEFTLRAKKVFERNGYIVQTIRTATQPWEEYFHSKKQILSFICEFESLTQRYGLDYYNIGTTKNPKNIPLIYDILKNSSRSFCTATISDEKKINFEAARATARLIKKLSTLDSKGFTNLRFAALFNAKPGSPFYPAAYHKGPTSFALGTENSDTVLQSFSKARNIGKTGSVLQQMLAKEYKKIEALAKRISQKEKIKYDGIDVSVAPSVNPQESIAYAFEKLGLGKFGEVGTLAVAKVVTDAVRNLEVKKCGYSGLMLPVLEDHGLATRNREGCFDLTNLLLYSAVCGTGLDTIPLPGDVSEAKLYALLLDIASLSMKLKKPLSARLMPIPKKKAGEMTTFKFEYFVNSRIMKI